jgi:pyridoxamine 5'-phosphate oxidase
VPERFEFWQGRKSRLHDRLVYSRGAASADEWTVQRLAP